MAKAPATPRRSPFDGLKARVAELETALTSAHDDAELARESEQSAAVRLRAAEESHATTLASVREQARTHIADADKRADALANEVTLLRDRLMDATLEYERLRGYLQAREPEPEPEPMPVLRPREPLFKPLDNRLGGGRTNFASPADERRKWWHR